MSNSFLSNAAASKEIVIEPGQTLTDQKVAARKAEAVVASAAMVDPTNVVIVPSGAPPNMAFSRALILGSDNGGGVTMVSDEDIAQTFARIEELHPMTHFEFIHPRGPFFLRFSRVALQITGRVPTLTHATWRKELCHSEKNVRCMVEAHQPEMVVLMIKSTDPCFVRVERLVNQLSLPNHFQVLTFKSIY
jgi:hypothetical protein